MQTNDAHFSSFIAGMLVSADRRRVGEIGLVDPRTGENMPVEAIAGKILSEHGELTAVVTICTIGARRSRRPRCTSS